MAKSADVLIIGAGAAGLAAAAELARAGRSVLVLEARDRIGGRVWSLHEPGLPVPVELGAEFIHGHPKAAFSLLERGGLEAVDAPLVRFIVQRGRLVPGGDRAFAEVRSAMLERLAALRNKDVSVQALLERMRRTGLSEDAVGFARRMVEGYEAAAPARASARAIAEDWSEGAGRGGHYRPAGGYGALLAVLADEAGRGAAELRLETIVHTMRWKRRWVEIEGTSRGKPFRAAAARAIVTLPLGVLQLPPGAPGAVRFVPALREKRLALKHLASGPVIKAALRFRVPFWEELDGARYRGATFFHAPDAPFPTFWTALPARAPLLIAWAGGPRAARLSAAGKRDIVRRAVASLESVFGRRARPGSLLVAAHVHNWQRDPYARGAYSYVTVGGTGARKALADPLRDTLYFAGEAADFEGEHGTVAGALQSGTRAALAVMASDSRRATKRQTGN